MKEPPPLVTPPTAPIPLEGVERFVVPATFGTMAGHGRARDAATTGLLRPADIDTARVLPVERVFVPLWRFEGSADGFHVGVHVHTSSSGRSLPLPHGGFRHHDGEVLVLARAHFPVDPSVHGRIASGDLTPWGEIEVPESELVLPDVGREQAEEHARGLLRRRGEARSALYSKVDVRIKSAALVWYPLYVVRYVYAGEATGGAEHVYHAAVSARTGKVASSEHPPVMASVGSKLKRLFS